MRKLCWGLSGNQARPTLDAYGYAAVAAEERARATKRTARLADFRRRLIGGPVLILRQRGPMRSFDPNALVPLGDAGTVYPTGTFQAEGGS